MPPAQPPSVLERRRRARSARKWWHTPFELELYGLTGRPVREHGAYLSNRAYHRVVNPVLHDREWIALVENKLLFSEHYAACGVPVPRTFGLLHPTYGFREGGGPLRSADDLQAWLRSDRPAGLVLKPVRGGRGSGVVIVTDVDLTSDPARLRLTSGEELTAAELHARQDFGLQGCLVQDRLATHPTLDELSGGAPSSLRVVTMRDRHGVPHVRVAIAQVGRPGGMVDNFPQGGLSIGIDVDTGRMTRGRLRPPLDVGWFTEHPDTHVSFGDLAVPHWGATIDACLRAAEHSPGLTSLGWDVVITPTGPVIVEGNVGWGLASTQIHTSGFLEGEVGRAWRELGADLPDGSFAWRWRHRDQSRTVGRLRALSERVGRRLGLTRPRA